MHLGALKGPIYLNQPFTSIHQKIRYFLNSLQHIILCWKCTQRHMHCMSFLKLKDKQIVHSVKWTDAIIPYSVSITRLWNHHVFLRTVRTSVLVLNGALLAGLHMLYEFYVHVWSMVYGSVVKNKLFKNMINFWCWQYSDWFSVNIEYVMLFHLTSLFKTEKLLIYYRLYGQDKRTGYSQFLQCILV